MFEVPNIDIVRAHTAENAEVIISEQVDKIGKAISNGIWQEAKSGRSEYHYNFGNVCPAFKQRVMDRVVSIFQLAGYSVTKEYEGYTFNWVGKSTN